MRVIPPQTIKDSDSSFTSSTAPETAPAAYAGGTTYAINDTVSTGTVGGVITVYKSLQSANTGHTPASSPTWWVSIGTTYSTWLVGTTYALGDIVIVTGSDTHLQYTSIAAANLGNVPATATDKWFANGADNKWAMFDLLRNTATTVPTSLTVVLTPGQRINSVALLGLVANSLTISATSATYGGSIFNTTVNLNTRVVTNWYDYFFTAFSTQASYVTFYMPPYSDCIVTITLSATSGNVSCGSCVIGTYVDLGTTQFNATSDVLNFSTVARDIYGNSTLTQRRNVPKTSQTVVFDKQWTVKVMNLRSLLNATPAVWFGLTDSTYDYFPALLILGIYKTFSINLEHPSTGLITLELEEV